MPMHIYPVAPPQTQTPVSPLVPAKRRQVKNACTHCQKACKKCDDARPCLRCVRYGVTDGCISSQRKERKKGYTRGPYKKRDGKSNYTQLTSSPGMLGQISATSGSLSGSLAQGLPVPPDYQQNQPYFTAPVPNQSEQYFWA